MLILKNEIGARFPVGAPRRGWVEFLRAQRSLTSAAGRAHQQRSAEDYLRFDRVALNWAMTGGGTFVTYGDTRSRNGTDSFS